MKEPLEEIEQKLVSLYIKIEKTFPGLHKLIFEFDRKTGIDISIKSSIKGKN